MGLTLYVGQLLEDFQSVLQETGQPVGYRHAAWGMALDVEDALKELRGSLKAMI
ncbi:hypothetical protein LJC64_05170 [Ruminococcaceae bacterium OttesenSCG-928-A11]|nr:hypothetical protein [Ruminococcaceae bacterium OttesenSCG-928-A11]